MKLIESDKFRKHGQELEKVLRENPELDGTAREALEIRKKQTEVHRSIEQRAGIKLKVVQEGGPRNAAAFVEHSAIRGGLREAYIVQSVLGNADHAFHAARHEAMHVRSGFTGIDMQKELNPEQREVLARTLAPGGSAATDASSLTDEVFWLEGFNELATISEIGKDQNCGYNDQEVPAVRKLEQLSIQHTGESLLHAYKSGNALLFYDRLRALCDALLIEAIRAAFKKAA